MNKNRQPDNVKKAQVENSPELSSVLKEMKNGFDIQPLDNIKNEELIMFEDNVIESNLTEEEKPKEKEKEKIEADTHTSHERDRRKKLVNAGVVAALAILVFVGIYLSFFHFDDFSHGVASVYEKNSSVMVMLENDDVIQLDNVVQLKLSDDGKIFAYSQNTDSRTGRYDIRVIDFTKRNSVKNKGSIIVNGVEENWYMEKSGSFIYYQKAEDDSIKYYAYSTESRETEIIVADADEFFAPPMGDICYFTRERAGTTMLYRSRFGEETESLGDVENVKAITNDEVMEIFFTVKDPDSTEKEFTLYKISGNGTRNKISDKVSEVYLDDYTPGGNLYYFVKNGAKFNWNDIIEDPYQDTDAAMQKPDKGDYLVNVGFFFKRTKLDEKAYNRAIAEYNKKQTRDKIREALDKTDLGLAVSAEYKVKVYDGQISKELAGSVKLQNLIAFAKTGAPRIIFKTTGIDSSQKIKMDDLYKLAQKKTVAESVDYVVEVLSDDYEISTGCRFSLYDGNKVMAYNFDPEAKIEDCFFDFLGRNSIIISTAGDETTTDLYISTVEGKEISKPTLINDKVVSFEVNGNTLYYEKTEKDITDLYVYTPDKGSTQICKNIVGYVVLDTDKAIAFNNVAQDGNLSSVELVLYSDEKTKSVDTDVNLEHFVAEGDSFAYIKKYKTAAATDTLAQTGGEFRLYSEGKAKTIDSDVSEIYVIKQ